MTLMEKKQVVDELHRSARKNFNRRRVIIKGYDDLWQADLVEMIPYADENNGYRYLLTIIDTFSKFAWGLAIKNKNSSNIVAAFKSVFKNGRIPKNLQTDNGTEFYNREFQKLMTCHKINHYSTFSHLKASIVERFNRTLKNMMWKEFSMNGTYKWINIIDNLILQYNEKKHRTIGMSPAQVTRKNENRLLKSAYNHIKISLKPLYKVGDHVRISKYKHVFEKGYTPNWTTEIFKIFKIRHTNPITYYLEDYQGNKIAGGFYQYEITRTKHPNFYLVQSIIKKHGDKVYVKWLGFDDSHNSWIKARDII